MRRPKWYVTMLLVGVFTLLWFMWPSKGSAQVSGTKNSASVQTIEGDSVAQKVVDTAKTSWPWYLSRGSGLVAAITLVLLMLSGIGQITGHTYKFWEPLTAWASHRALGLVFGVSVLLHMFSLLFDHFINFNILDILVPWWSKFKPVDFAGLKLGSLYLAFGIISFYLTLIVVITSLIWISKKAKTWKLIHFLSYVLMALVFFHALFLGTDLADGWMRAVWVFGGLAIFGSSIVRAWRAFTT